jgi:ABC-type dipeptide/oligopeptide/nickel transport system permease component
VNKGGEFMAQKAYFGLNYIVSLILCFFFGWVLGIVVRFQREKYLMAVLNVFLFPAFWLLDFISMIVNKDLEWLA